MGFCKFCGNEMEKDSLFCSKCGKRQFTDEEDKEAAGLVKLDSNQKSVRKWIVNRYSLVLILFILAGLGSWFYYISVNQVSKNVSKVIDLVNKGNVAGGSAVYKQLLTDNSLKYRTKTINKINSKLLAKMEELSNNYLTDAAGNFDEASQIISDLKQFPEELEVAEQKLIRMTKVKDSRAAFANGKKFSEAKDYANAINEYKKVVAEDSFHYPSIQEQISQSTKEMYDYVLENADKLNDQKQYENAYKLLGTLKDYYKDDAAIKDKSQTYLKSLYEENLVKANELFTKKDFDGALSQLQSTEVYFTNDAKLGSLKDQYLIAKQAAVEQEKINRENRKKELLAMTSKKVDDMRQTTSIVAKGDSPEYINVDNNVNLDPRINLTNDNETAVFQVTVGFSQSDWVFFDKVIFNVDGELFTWDVDYLDRQTTVFMGGISEWTSELSITNKDLLIQMTKVANGKNVKMRFQGGKALRDHVVTAKEKANTKLLLELYGYYENLDHFSADSSTT